MNLDGTTIINGPTEGERKLQSVIDQLREVNLGTRTNIQCLYCNHHSRPVADPADWPRPMVSPFCCDLFESAAGAIAEREALRIQTEHKKRIEDQLSNGVDYAGRA